MANPDQFIDITDFSPGIWGDYHAATGAQNTADPTLKGAMPGNGIARVEGTARCHADKTGALVPLPKCQITGVPDPIGPSWNLQPNRQFRYVLDAQLGNDTVDASLTSVTPITEVRRPVEMMWGYWADDVADYHPIVVGREYRPWMSRYETDQMFDFLVADAVGEAVGGTPILPLPIGQLCDGRFYLGNTDYGGGSDRHAFFPSNMTGGNQLQTPDAAIFDVVGDITLYALIQPMNLTGGPRVLLGKWTSVGNQRSYILYQSGSQISIVWSSNGLAIAQAYTSDAGLLADITSPTWVAVSVDVDNGAAGHNVRFWKSKSVIDHGEGLTLGTGVNSANVVFAQHGATVTTAGVTSIFSSSAPVLFGGSINDTPLAQFWGTYQGRLYGAAVAASFGTATAPSIAGTGWNPANIPSEEVDSFVTGGGTITRIRVGAVGVSLIVPSVGFKPSWMYPVSVALAATPWYQWGAGNVLRTTALTPLLRYQIGLAPSFELGFALYSPGVGVNGVGTCTIAMDWHNPIVASLPQASAQSYWYHHMNEANNVFAQGNIEVGPMNPYLMVAHQGRVVMADRRRSRPLKNVVSQASYGHRDSLILYSDYALPLQNPQLDLSLYQTGTPAVTVNSYGAYPSSIMDPYKMLIVGEDDPSEIGAVGVTTVDQMLVVKHRGGGVMVTGDLNSPTVRRLPYVEPTGGVVCKGTHTPLGFVYGSPNGIFVWQGGEQTQKLSPQIDGFFWDHTAAIPEESYAGSRGRMCYWNNMICVPNNYVFDVDRQSWWRFKVPDLQPVAADLVPYNCYDRVDTILYAFPYRNKWPTTTSKVTFPSGPTQLNSLSVPDAANFSAPTRLDIRFAVADVASGSTVRAIVGHYDTSGNQRSWKVAVNALDQLVFTQSTTGAADAFTLTSSTFTTADDVILGRVTWDSTVTPNNVKFWTKSITGGIPEPAIAAALRSNDEWVQLGASQTGAVAALFNSTAPLRVGNNGAALSEPYIGRIYGVEVRVAPLPETSIDAPVVALIPADFPSNIAAASFPCSTGQTVTVTRAGAGNQLTLSYVNPPVAVWHTFDPKALDNEYTWQSHPLIESRGRRLSIQQVQVMATAKDDAAAALIEVTLQGFDQDGELITSGVTTLNLGQSPEPQLLMADVTPNFNAEYITLKLRAVQANVALAAPKIHSVRIGYGERARVVRNA